MDAVPLWVREHNLRQVGLYYEGYVHDIDLVRQQHQAYTVSTFGIRRSWANSTQKTSSEVKSDCEDGVKENKVCSKQII